MGETRAIKKICVFHVLRTHVTFRSYKLVCRKLNLCRVGRLYKQKVYHDLGEKLTWLWLWGEEIRKYDEGQNGRKDS